MSNEIQYTYFGRSGRTVDLDRREAQDMIGGRVLRGWKTWNRFVEDREGVTVSVVYMGDPDGSVWAVWSD